MLDRFPLDKHRRPARLLLGRLVASPFHSKVQVLFRDQTGQQATEHFIHLCFNTLYTIRALSLCPCRELPVMGVQLPESRQVSAEASLRFTGRGAILSAAPLGIVDRSPVVGSMSSSRKGIEECSSYGPIIAAVLSSREHSMS